MPEFKFATYLLDLVTKYAFLHEIIFNIFVKKFLRSFICPLIKEDIQDIIIWLTFYWIIVYIV